MDEQLRILKNGRRRNDYGGTGAEPMAAMNIEAPARQTAGKEQL